MWFQGSYYVSLDTEFISNNLTRTGTLSIGLATEEHRAYGVNGLADTEMRGLDPDSKEWMRANVWPHLPGGSPENFDRSNSAVATPEGLANLAENFFGKVMDEVNHDMDKVVVVALCGAQDMVRLHGLWDHNWAMMPRVIPNWFRDIADMRRRAHLSSDQLPVRKSGEHHALLDAVHQLDQVRFILENDPMNEEVF
jgi:hypothetical protein